MNNSSESSNVEQGMKKILVIDDEPDYRFVLRQRLEANGYNVIEADNGINGLIAVRSLPLDLIILDVLLPIVDGYTLAWFFKSDPTSRHIPLVMLTVLSHENDIKKGMAVGADAYLIKPCDHHQLLNTISTHLHKSHSNE
ncbi:MAG: response regulator [Kiritimatiellae bacterium]|nr:response regulator [Kiritimatiellia bacterium]